MAIADPVTAPGSNAAITEALTTLADLLEIRGANPFHIRAYRSAASAIAQCPQTITDLLAAGAELPDLGLDAAKKIEEFIATGKLQLLEETKRVVPAGLLDLRHVGGLGPKRIQTLHRELSVCCREDLARAARSGEVALLRGFGPKIQEWILRDLQQFQQSFNGHWRRDAVETIARPLLRYLRGCPAVAAAELAGDYRRGRETVRQLTIVICSEQAPLALQTFALYSDVRRLLSREENRASVILNCGMPVNVVVAGAEHYGAALMSLTGTDAHCAQLRQSAARARREINEYGVFRDYRYLAGQREEDVYRAIDLPWIPPELRDGRGEVQAAGAGRLPALVDVSDIRGDLHVHTQATDGVDSLHAMMQGARDRGYEYIAITDHSKHLRAAHGLTQDRLLRQLEEIDRLNREPTPVRVLKAVEVDILADGTLDLPDFILQKLDLVIGAIHDRYDLPPARQTERLIRAMDNPYLNILAHPTGRLLGERPACAMDLETVMLAAKARGCALEINARPDRLDLNDAGCRLAKHVGVKLVLVTDAHSVGELDNIRFGITQARRAWLEARDVLNCQGLDDLKRALRRR